MLSESLSALKSAVILKSRNRKLKSPTEPTGTLSSDREMEILSPPDSKDLSGLRFYPHSQLAIDGSANPRAPDEGSTCRIMTPQTNTLLSGLYVVGLRKLRLEFGSRG